MLTNEKPWCEIRGKIAKRQFAAIIASGGLVPVNDRLAEGSGEPENIASAIIAGVGLDALRIYVRDVGLWNYILILESPRENSIWLYFAALVEDQVFPAREAFAETSDHFLHAVDCLTDLYRRAAVPIDIAHDSPDAPCDQVIASMLDDSLVYRAARLA